MKISTDSIFMGGLGLFMILSIPYFMDFCKLTFNQAIKVYFYILIFVVYLGFVLGFTERVIVLMINFIGSIIVLFIFKKFWWEK